MSSTQILILRLSSFGDIIQTFPAIDLLNKEGFVVDYYTKTEFKYCTEPHTGIRSTYYYSKKSTFWKELSAFRALLKQHQYDVVYDAHSNNRSYLFRLFTSDLRLLNKRLRWIRRPKFRFKRLLYFKFKKRDVFPQPMIACQSFINPLIKSGLLPEGTKPALQVNTTYCHEIERLNQYTNKAIEPNGLNLSFQNLLQHNFIVIAPSAAWPLKRWPKEYFQDLIDMNQKHIFVILGGPADEFAKVLTGKNVINMVGQLNWSETGYMISKSSLVVAADTGVLHWADYMGSRTIGLLGPTAFGQPYQKTTHVFNLNLPCSPCTKDGRGKCKIAETQKCLRDIKPIDVSHQIDKIMSYDGPL